MLNPFTAGQKLRAVDDVTAHDIRRIVCQTADSAPSTSTTFLNSSLVLSVVASGLYKLTTQIFVDTNATADVVLNVLLPSGSTVRFSDLGSTTTSTSTSRTYPGVAAGTVISCEFSGFIDIDTSSGNLTIQYRQVSASGSTIVKVGSTVELTRIA